MRARGCVYAHTASVGSSNWRNCARGTLAGLDAFAAAHGLRVASRGAGWCRDAEAYMYGNFVGGWVPFPRARAQVALVRFLFENVTDFVALADQGAARASLCMRYDVPSLGSLRWGPTGRHLCDFSDWRHRLKAFAHPGQPAE